MKIDTLLFKSPYHINHNEDAQISEQLNNDWFVAAVMDGCSTGVESYFISGLYAKLIRKSLKTVPFLEKISPALKLEKLSSEALGEIILNQVFDETKMVSKRLLLNPDEILSTLILMVYHIPTKNLYINISGDGCYSVNGKCKEIDQLNMPDFMGYHFDKEFSDWFKNHSLSLSFSNVSSAYIATDGITKFADNKRNFDKADKLSFFLSKHPKLASLEKKLSYFLESKKLTPLDDISVVGFES